MLRSHNVDLFMRRNDLAQTVDELSLLKREGKYGLVRFAARCILPFVERSYEKTVCQCITELRIGGPLDPDKTKQLTPPQPMELGK